jgi:Kdo2-lipid IVA lauroyltransferase/acyltransferase
MFAYLLVRLLLAVPVCAPLFVRLLDIFVPKLRRTARENLLAAGYPTPEPIIDGVFRNIVRIAQTFAAFPAITRANVHQWIAYDGLDNFTSAQAKGKGVLVATAHLGNWELSAFTHALMTAPMHIVVRPLDNPRLDAFVEQRRALTGNPVIPKKDAARGILRALARNHAVGVLIDQNAAPDEGVFVQFFGRPACAHSAFVRLAHRSGAPVVPGFALWDEATHKHILRFYPEIPMSGDVAADTQRVHSHLESVIRQHPDQWLWLHRRWKTQPDPHQQNLPL